MKRNVIILTVCQALMMSGNSLLITATALVGLQIAPQPQWATIPFALMFAGVIITTYPASMMMQRAGRKAGFSLGAVIGICGGGISAWSISAQSFSGFCLGSVMLGAFNAFGQYYRFAAAEAAGEDFRSRAISYVLAGGILAAFVGPNLAMLTREILATEFSGNYACIAVIYCCTLLLVQGLQLQSSDHGTPVPDSIPLLEIVRKPHFVIAVASGMVGYGVMNLLMTATPMAMMGHGFHFNQTATVIQWHVVGMFAPALFTGHLIDRFGAYPVMIAGTLGLLLGCLTNLGGMAYWQFTTSLVLLGIGWNFCFIGATSLLTQDAVAKGKVQGLNDFLVFFTVGMTALTSGQLHHYLGWRAISVGVIPVILCVSAILLWSFFKLPPQARISHRLK
jgi:MFS family permease